MSTVAGDGSADGGWTIVVPVKALDRAKSRLAPALTATGRRALVLAMAEDVLRACASTPGVSRVRVVTSDPDMTALARDLLPDMVPCDIVPEPPHAADRAGDPLNTALAAAIHGVPGPVGVVTADLPELRAAHLARVLDVAGTHPHSVVPDHRGAGTTMAFWTGTAVARVPRFGVDSAARHLAEGGAVPLHDADPSGAATRDVDTPADVAALTDRAVGEATTAVLRTPAVAQGAHAAGVSATMVR
ncbi:2-phospho-L-lactate guanylyltransferase [Dietzia sp. PP-33]|jgi:2-phospho-L-lactate guanylyltransferase|uniref:2-phospho-L-lactate guanylyltransferase n=1 Tax=Dietzia sp. PP-33 TaxID=2957500 RepID=UPI0029AA5C48|nr:2-phospho-L-lactate guanylyltransferase [Dietzia sp. PP-33]MDX2355666.1 2-phospho-L-lactate guanylyltransferase [Dietzia sp. PP-33]